MQQAMGYAQKMTQRKHLHAVSDDVAAQVAPPGATLQRRIVRPGTVLYVLKLGDSTKQILRLSCNPDLPATAVAHAYKQWRALGVPVPNMYAYGEHNHVQYVRMEYMPGDAFSFMVPQDVQHKTLGQMGTHLATMRQVPCEGYGFLDNHSRGRWASWQEFLKSSYRPHWLVATGRLQLEQAKKMSDFIASRHTKIGRAVLVHNDYKPKNMLVSADGAITGILDPQPLAGDPLWDVATCNHFMYREQARQGRDFADPEYDGLRQTFYDDYVDALGRPLTADEQQAVAGYELLIDGAKAEKLLRFDGNLVEGTHTLDYLHRKLEVFI